MTFTGRRPALPDPLRASRVVAILRRLPPEEVMGRIGMLCGVGIGCVEITIDSPGALRTVEEAKRRHPHMAFGLGTVTEPGHISQASDVGADFVLSPHGDPDLIRRAVDAGMPILPGAYTATEAIRAWSGGSSAVKLFPAEPSGVDYLMALRQPLPHLPFMPTGGITPGNAAAYFAAGAALVAVGGSLAHLEGTGLRDAADTLLAAAAAAPAWPW